MKDIVDYIVKQFVTNPDAVEVNEEMQGDGYVNITLKVAPEDMGLTIGKSGQTIKAIRRLLTIKAIAENVRVNLQLLDSGEKPQSESSEDSGEEEVAKSENSKEEDEASAESEVSNSSEK